MPLDLAHVYRITAIFLGLGQLLAGAEMVFLHRTGQLDRYLPWKVVRLRLPAGTGSAKPVDALFSPPAMQALGVARCAAGAAACALSPFSPGFAAALLVLMVILCLDSFRNLMGGEGADQMFLIITICLLVGGNPLSSSLITKASIVFIAAQSVLSYTAAGIAKAASGTWRSGAAIPGILLTYGYGIPAVGRFFSRHYLLAGATAWSVIVLESTFPVALVSPATASLYIAAAACFHLCNAWIMGLNAFVLAFPATYLPVLWTAVGVSSALFGAQPSQLPLG